MDHIHTQIPNPLEMRKHILEGAVIATETLKRCEDAEKLLEAQVELRRQTAELCQMLQTETSVLERSLPPLPDEFTGQRKVGFVRYQTEQDAPQVRRQPQKSKLELEIEDIRKKLSALQR